MMDTVTIPLDGRQDQGVSTIAWLRGFMLALMMVVVVFMTTTSMAAEYDPALCPDAQQTAAALSFQDDRTVPPAWENGDPRGTVTCTLCCHPSHNFTPTATPPAEPAPAYPPHRLPVDSVATAFASDALLRPPRG